MREAVIVRNLLDQPYPTVLVAHSSHPLCNPLHNSQRLLAPGTDHQWLSIVIDASHSTHIMLRGKVSKKWLEWDQVIFKLLTVGK
jgi:hypothetical protein